ncbi:glutathione S-transferase family protein [Phenylobacterium montanum]|uniref:Glutathione S-transferase n=1 Tax=Phenylobacterium montanum TaxID=2823693 RepID=A0A975FY05_9CAUL|nr:glutathione S-transferase [Caulobacter sp. S6]QUD86366.1 glutathione S-transferase [Caulobacter sp. S6]
MKLIGMWDSPYVRRVAISLRLMGLPFQAEQLSVFRNFDEFAAVSPVVKAPSLVTDEGVVLMDSTLILEHLERLAPAGRSLIPQDPAAHLKSLKIIGLAMAACEKTVQVVYEHNLRPAAKLHEPWLERVTGQLQCAFAGLEAEIGDPAAWLTGDRIQQADVTTAVAWTFTRFTQPGLADPAAYPKLAAFASRLEALPEFRDTPLE